MKATSLLFTSLGLLTLTVSAAPQKQPNLVFIMADQMRALATGYAGDPNLQGKTPNLDRLAAEGVNFCNAVSTMPVCTPFRGSMLTGRYPLSTGLFMNDVPLSPAENSIAKVYKAAGYNTGYVGKWHVDGHGRMEYIPPERRQGFDYWKVLECTHDYMKSAYYDNNDPKRKYWPGYDVIAQTTDAQEYITKNAATGKPFIFFLSWGAPHDPYKMVPDQYKKLFPKEMIKLRANVPGEMDDKTRDSLQGYYAHIVAIDECLGRLMRTIHDAGIEDNTILMFTADHGDMIGSQGGYHKQRPEAESASVPFLIRYPAAQRVHGAVKTPIGTPDIMPTLLGLSGLRVPSSVEGEDLSPLIRGERPAQDRGVLIECVVPFGDWATHNGREFRAIKTERYTYVRDLKGPWLFYDNEKDPDQMSNLVGNPEAAPMQKQLNQQLDQLLAQRKDEFLPGADYEKKWNYGHHAGKKNGKKADKAEAE